VRDSLCEGVRTEVAQFARFEIAPDHLDRVQVVRVAGQLIDGERGSLRSDECDPISQSPICHYI
jgi:hypothetical protein